MGLDFSSPPSNPEPVPDNSGSTDLFGGGSSAAAPTGSTDLFGGGAGASGAPFGTAAPLQPTQP